jgi:hypothetical protein
MSKTPCLDAKIAGSWRPQQAADAPQTTKAAETDRGPLFFFEAREGPGDAAFPERPLSKDRAGTDCGQTAYATNRHFHP